MAEWTPERLSSWAGDIGEETRKMIEQVMSQCRHPEQGFNMSMGIINLAKKFGNVRLEQACRRANEYEAFSYRKVRNILEKDLENESDEQKETSTPTHENIRGENYYH